MVSFKEFQKVELRVALVLEVLNHPKADRLYIIRCSLGDRCCQIVGGIKQFYSPEELVNKKIVIVANLDPVMLRGVRSCGMLLAGRQDETVTVLSLAEDIKEGTLLS